MPFTRKNDIFYKRDIDDTNKALEEASAHFREHRLSHHKGMLVLARNGLLYETEEQIEQGFLAQEEEQQCKTPGIFLTENAWGVRDVPYVLQAVEIMHYSKDQELLRWGYPSHANTYIYLPDEAEKKWGDRFLGFSVKELLHANAAYIEADYPDQAAMYRSIADEFYLAEDEAEVEDEDDEEYDDEIEGVDPVDQGPEGVKSGMS